MQTKKTCEYCKNIFEYDDKKRKYARFCSRKCREKLLRKEQLEGYRKYLENETDEQKLEWLKEHYEKFVIRNENCCWGWSGSLDNGYGQLNHRGKIIKAHRASWIIHNGKIPDGLFILHHCDNPVCSNPKHLFIGNNSDNVNDMIRKGRRIKGDCANKLNAETVKTIKKLIALGVPSTKLAKQFHVHRSTIERIKHGKFWKDLKLENQSITRFRHSILV
jgi:HNH endonuclease